MYFPTMSQAWLYVLLISSPHYSFRLASGEIPADKKAPLHVLAFQKLNIIVTGAEFVKSNSLILYLESSSTLNQP